MKILVALALASGLAASAAQAPPASTADSKKSPDEEKIRLIGCLHRSGSTFTLDQASDITATPTTGEGSSSSSATGTSGATSSGSRSGSSTTATYQLVRDSHSPDLGGFVDSKVQVVGVPSSDGRSARTKAPDSSTGTTSGTAAAAGATTAAGSADTQSTGAASGATPPASSSTRVIVRTVLHVSSSCS